MVRFSWLVLVLVLAAPIPAAADPGTVVVRYGFDAASGTVTGTTDDSGQGHTLHAVGTRPVAAVALCLIGVGGLIGLVAWPGPVGHVLGGAARLARMLTRIVGSLPSVGSSRGWRPSQ